MSKLQRYSKRAAALDDFIAYLSKMPLPVHGNWCGPNYGSGEAIDELDSLCREHDEGYSGDKVSADRKFISRIRKMANPSLKARAIAALFEKIILPLRVAGVLDSGVINNSFALTTMSNSSSRTSLSPHPSVAPILKFPGSYLGFIQEYGTTVGGQTIPAGRYFWKNGGYSSTTTPDSVTGLFTMNTSAITSGTFPSNTASSARYQFAPGRATIYSLRVALSQLIAPTPTDDPNRFRVGFLVPTAQASQVNAPECFALVSGSDTLYYKEFLTASSVANRSYLAEAVINVSITPPYSDSTSLLSIAPFIYALDSIYVDASAGTKLIFTMQGLMPIASANAF